MKKRENSERLNKDFGNFIRAKREQKDLFQSDVATLVGISQAYYSYIEQGKRDVDLALAIEICKVLGIDISDFITTYM